MMPETLPWFFGGLSKQEKSSFGFRPHSIVSISVAGNAQRSIVWGIQLEGARVREGEGGIDAGPGTTARNGSHSGNLLPRRNRDNEA